MNKLVLMMALVSGTPLPKGKLAHDYIIRSCPTIENTRAWKLGWTIEHYSNLFGLDIKTMIAILRQESNFRHGLAVLNTNGTYDLGVSQINEIWIPEWKLDKDRLQNDDGYSIWIMARILKQLKDKFAGTESTWWSHYNSNKDGARLKYEQLIKTHLMFMTAL